MVTCMPLSVAVLVPTKLGSGIAEHKAPEL